MSLESVFLNLVRGNRITSFMGLRLPAEGAPKYGPLYTYVEIPFGTVLKDGELVVGGKVIRNQYVQIVPACTVDCRGRDVILVEPNPALAEFGMTQASYYIHPGSGEQAPSFYFQARKDVAIEDLGYAVRLYMQP